MWRRGSWVAAVGLTLVMTAAVLEQPALAAVKAATVLEQLAASSVDGASAVVVRGHRLRSGLATIELEDGVLVPAGPVGSRPAELVFEGTGRIVVDPPDEVEAGQLELFTGARRLDERFERAVFVIALDSAVDTILGLPSAAGDPKVARAAEELARWRSSAERKLLDVDARLFANAFDNPVGSTFFCGSFEGSTLGRFLYVVDPAADEQVTLGRFTKPELSRREQRQIERRLLREQRQGKLIGLEVADVGKWDTWVSAHLRDGDGEPLPGNPGAEPTAYTIDVKLAGPPPLLEATARLRLRVQVDGLRVVTLEMNPDLELVTVTDGAGRRLPHQRTRDELAVLLPAVAAAGDEVEVEVGYRCSALERLAVGVYSLRSTLGWYPHAGSVDRATYDVTLRWPAALDLEGSGRVVEDGAVGLGVRRQRRILEQPSLGFSFEVGRFQVASGSAGHVQVTVAIDPIGQQSRGDMAGDVLATVCDCLAYFEEVFGPYPLDYLTVVSVPRRLSQGLLGYVTLSTAGIQDWEGWGKVLEVQDRRTLIAHEVAHQWWGNLVGWSSYRDQWISEAMANYSALLYARDRLGGEAAGNGPISGWQFALLSYADNGRPVESLGPVVLGSRLSSSIDRGAYRAIIYVKGALILNTLASYVGDLRFQTILGEVVRQSSGRLLSTDGFLELVERLAGTDLSRFRRQYVEGTALPEITYSYRIAEVGDGTWVVEGAAEPLPETWATVRVVERPDGTLDVLRELHATPVAPDWVVACPVQVGMAGRPPGGDPRSEPAVRMVRGRAVLGADSASFRFVLPERPQALWLDRYQEVYCRFFSQTLEPRRAAYQRGLDLLAAGLPAEAEATFRSALAKPVTVAPEAFRPPPHELESEDRMLAAAIRIALARLCLDDGRDTEAGREVAAADELTTGLDRRQLEGALVALQARLAVRGGEARSALRMLRLRLEERHDLDAPEAWAMLAVAARSAGRSGELGEACRMAARRGVDVTALDCPGN